MIMAVLPAKTEWDLLVKRGKAMEASNPLA